MVSLLRGAAPRLSTIVLVLLALVLAGVPNASAAPAHPAGGVVHVTILPDGSLSTNTAPISVSGNTYTLTADMNGTIVDERNGSVLNGAGHDLNSTGAGASALTLLTVSDVQVNDFLITNATHAISVNSSATATLNQITSRDFAGADTAVQIGNSTGVTVGNSTLASGASYGVHVFQSSSVRVQDDNLSASHGVQLDQVTGSAIVGDLAYRVPTTYGFGAISVLDSVHAYIRGNNVSGDSNAIFLYQTTGVTLLSNSANDSNSYAIFAEGSSFLNVTDNYAEHDYRALFLEGVENASLYHDSLQLNYPSSLSTYGIYLSYTSNVVGAGINASGHEYGLYTYAATNVTLSSLNLTYSTGYGACEEYSSNLRLSHSELGYSDYPIYTYGPISAVAFLADNVSYATSGVGVYLEGGGTVIGGENVGNEYGIYAYYALAPVLLEGVNISTTNVSGSVDVYAVGSSSLTVEGGNLSYAEYGIYTGYTAAVSVNGTHLWDLRYGTYEYSSDGMVRFDNVTFHDPAQYFSSSVGIYDEYSSQLQVWGGSFTGTDYGVESDWTGSVTVQDTTLRSITDYGIYTEYIVNVSIAGVRGYGPWAPTGSASRSSASGFGDYASTRVRLQDSYFQGWEYAVWGDYEASFSVVNVSTPGSAFGVYPYYTAQALVSDSNLNGDNISLDFWGVNSLTVVNNTATSDTADAAYFGYDLGGNVADNHFTGSKGYALWVYSSLNLVLNGNNDSGAGGYALAIDSSQNITAVGNDLSNSYWGFELNNSSTIQLVGNRLAADTWAFSLNNSTGLLAYHNNFIRDGPVLFKGSSSANRWNDSYPIGGNYWSAYTGKDNFKGPGQNVPGSDGIGDTPYVIAAGIAVDHYPLMQAWSEHTITFVEYGLPAGTPWSITLNGTLLSGTGASLAYLQTNGAWTAYSYTVGGIAGYRPTQASGNGTYQQANIVIPVYFRIVNYTVTFAEVGLPTGTSWGVSISYANANVTGNGTLLSLPAANGTWSYRPLLVNGYRTSGGSVTVNGADVNLTVTFTPVVYAVTFVPLGLPSGTNWSVTLGSTTLTNLTGPITFSQPNGTYRYSVGPVSGFVAPPNGTLSVLDGPVQLDVSFAASYAVSFGETGLPSGQSWSITVSGLTQNGVVVKATTLAGTTSGLSLDLAGGFYYYTVGSVAGYNSTPSSGSFSVSGSPASISIQFTKPTPSTPPTTSSPSGLSGLDWALIAVVIVLAILALIGWTRGRRPAKESSPPGWSGPPPTTPTSVAPGPSPGGGEAAPASGVPGEGATPPEQPAQ